MMSPQATALLTNYPAPNVDDDRFNYQTAVPVFTRRANVQSRFTHVFSAGNSLTGALRYQNNTGRSGDVFGFTDSNQIKGFDATLSWAHRFTRSRGLRVSYQITLLSTTVTPHFAWRTNVSGDAGIVGNNQDPENWGPPALLFSSGLAGFSNQQYASNQDRTHIWLAEHLWNRGRHAMRIGGGVRRLEFDVLSQQNARGTFSFTGAATGSDLADFLVGIPHSSSIAFGNADKLLRGSGLEAYVNDDWRLSPSLSINAGVRWDYESPLAERDGRLVNLDLASDFTAAAPVTATDSVGSVSGRQYPVSLLHPDLRGIQPRLSFAWRPVPGSSLVMRGGYGVYRITNTYRPIALLMAQQPPLSVVVNAENSATNLLTLANGFSAPHQVTLPTFGVNPDFRVGHAHSWQLSIQKDLPASMVVTVSYLGTKGSYLMQEILPNTYPAGAAHPCPECPAGFAYLSSGADSRRHGAQVQLRRRLRNGLAASLQVHALAFN